MMKSHRNSLVYVDVREAGAHKRYGVNHGIARYAREIIARLSIEWSAFDRPFRPATPVDVINPNRARLSRSAVLYSPGFSAGIAKCTQLVTIHDLTPLRTPHSRLKHIYYERVLKPAVRHAGHVLTDSETSAAEVRDWLGNDRVTVHIGGVGCSSEFTPEGPAYTYDRPYFLYVGNFKDHKNPRPLFEAMASFPDHLLVVVSAAAEIQAARAFANQYGLVDRLRIQTAVSDAVLASLYRGSDALVFPSRWEGFGLPVLEALMTGTKVVYNEEAASVAEICHGGQFAVGKSGGALEFAHQMALAVDSDFSCPTDLTKFQWETVVKRVETVIRCVQNGG